MQAAAAVVVVGVALAIVVVTRHADAGSTPAAGRRVTLSAEQRRVLAGGRSLVNALPQALHEVPLAASDLSGGSVTPAAAANRLARIPALAGLDRELHGLRVTRAVIAGYDAALTGRAVRAATALPDQVARLQALEGQLLPAIRVLAGRAGVRLPAGVALQRVEADRAVPELSRLLAQWPAAYGALSYLEQAADS